MIIPFGYFETDALDADFVIEWTTTTSPDTVVIPFTNVGSYNCVVEYGDGEPDGTVTTWDDADATHIYATAGTYEMRISGTWGSFKMNNASAYKTLLTEIKNWGTNAPFQLNFWGCSLCTITATDLPDLSNLSSFIHCFRNMSILITIPNLTTWDVGHIAVFTTMFYQCDGFNQDLTGLAWDGAINDMLGLTTDFDQDLSGMDWSGITNGTNFLLSNALSTANYDATLIGMDGQSLTASVTIHFGNSTYTKTQVDSGTTDGTTANKLVDSSQNFLTTVSVNDIAHNTTDDTYAKVTAVDDDQTLSLNADIMVSGETYQIETSAAVKAKESIINGDSWTIDDGGGV
jgi:hypothetical protein